MHITTVVEEGDVSINFDCGMDTVVDGQPTKQINTSW